MGRCRIYSHGGTQNRATHYEQFRHACAVDSVAMQPLDEGLRLHCTARHLLFPPLAEEARKSTNTALPARLRARFNASTVALRPPLSPVLGYTESVDSTQRWRLLLSLALRERADEGSPLRVACCTEANSVSFLEPRRCAVSRAVCAPTQRRGPPSFREGWPPCLPFAGSWSVCCRSWMHGLFLPRPSRSLGDSADALSRSSKASRDSWQAVVSGQTSPNGCQLRVGVCLFFVLRGCNWLGCCFVPIFPLFGRVAPFSLAVCSSDTPSPLSQHASRSRHTRIHTHALHIRIYTQHNQTQCSAAQRH